LLNPLHLKKNNDTILLAYINIENSDILVTKVSGGFIVNTFTLILIITLVVLLIGLIALRIIGKRMEKRQAEQKEQMAAVAQTISMLVIDKSKMKLKDAGLPSVVYESTPKYLRRSKVPVVKAKVGPKIMTFMCDSDVYPLIPVKKEIKAVVSGIYITGVKGLRGQLEKPTGKRSLKSRLKDLRDKYQK